MFICWGRDVYFRVELLGHELVNHLGSNLMKNGGFEICFHQGGEERFLGGRKEERGGSI